MRSTEPGRGLAGLLALALAAPALAAPGLATRDLNPILQGVFLPRYASPPPRDGWRLDHSLHITNTFQAEDRDGEILVIDVENYRYTLDPGYRRGDWVFAASLPFVASRGGELDRLIEDWHDLFGLPQGGRTHAPRDRLEIRYTRDGITEFVQDRSSDGIGDLALTLGFHPPGAVGYYLGVELPSGSETDFSGNESLDWGLWSLGQRQIDDALTLYGLFGVSFPGDDGALAGRLAERIWVAQLGLEYRFNDRVLGIAQLDLHSRWLERSRLRAFGNSTQLQLGLGFEGFVADHRLDLYFSEDIDVKTAPDITFGARLTRNF